MIGSGDGKARDSAKCLDADLIQLGLGQTGELLQGDLVVQVESDLGVGTTMRMLLPRSGEGSGVAVVDAAPAEGQSQ